MTAINDGLYSTSIEMHEGANGRATGVIMLQRGRLYGGDSYFYYTGSYEVTDASRWRGELITHQHTHEPGLNFVFGGRNVQSDAKVAGADILLIHVQTATAPKIVKHEQA